MLAAAQPDGALIRAKGKPRNSLKFRGFLALLALAELGSAAGGFEAVHRRRKLHIHSPRRKRQGSAVSLRLLPPRKPPAFVGTPLRKKYGDNKPAGPKGRPVR